MGELSKTHAMEMMGDEDHRKAMGEMQEKMNDPEAMKEWMETKRKEFEAQPDNS
jgi:hypothetical protein